MSLPFAEIEARIGYTFKKKELLEQAFTHSTYANAYGKESNERMEYLGDAVLQLVVTEWQYKSDSRAEGKLSEMRQKLVCKEALETALDGLDVYKYLLMFGRAQNLGEKTRSNLFEALIAAIYLDGGYGAARKFILRHGNIRRLDNLQNYKGALQEFVQARGKDLPRYSSKKEGSDHAPHFRCTARAMGESADGEGRSRKEAEALAASRLYYELTKKYGK